MARTESRGIINQFTLQQRETHCPLSTRASHCKVAFFDTLCTEVNEKYTKRVARVRKSSVPGIRVVVASTARMIDKPQNASRVNNREEDELQPVAHP